MITSNQRVMRKENVDGGAKQSMLTTGRSIPIGRLEYRTTRDLEEDSLPGKAHQKQRVLVD